MRSPMRLAPVLLALLLPAGAAAQADGDPRCRQHGEGFVFSEAFSTCIRIAGSIESSYRFGSGSGGFGSEGSVSLDARKDTGLGPVRLYVKPKMQLD